MSSLHNTRTDDSTVNTMQYSTVQYNAIQIQYNAVQCNNATQWNSGGSSAVKETGHFEVRKSSSQVTPMYFFPQKSFFSCRPQNTDRQRRLHGQNKTNKAVRYSNIFIFLLTLLPKQSNTQG